MLDSDALAHVVAEWLRETQLPEAVRRETATVDVGNLRAILAVVGPRRAGKTWFLFQLIRDLMAQGVRRDEVLFVDFEDYRLRGLTAANVDGIFAAFERLAGHPPRFLFFDEVQSLPEWSRVLRTLHNRNRYRIIVTGSNSSLLRSEIATELRGRYEDLLLMPFSFREYLLFRGIPHDDASLLTPTRGRVMAAFDDFLVGGGFPETFNVPTLADKRRLLQNYYETTFYRDLIERHGIKAHALLDRLMADVLDNAADLFSISSFEGHLKAAQIATSKRTLANYLRYLREAMFIIMTGKFAHSPRVRMKNPAKIYLMDTGFSLLSNTLTANRGKLLENAVATEFYRRREEIFYHRERMECDFVIKHDRRLTQAWQVCWELTNRNEGRELRGLLEAARQFGIPSGGILTYDQEETRSVDGKPIRLIPVWKWLATRPAVGEFSISLPK